MIRGMEIDPQDWLRRYAARWRARKPEMTDAELAELTQDAHEALSAHYPDNPEAAVDDDLHSPEGHHMSSSPPPIYSCFGQLRGYCYRCHTGMPLTAEKRLPEHTHLGERCAGSGTVPTAEPG